MTILRVVNPYTLIVASTMNMIITNLSVENYNIKKMLMQVTILNKTKVESVQLEKILD